ncbi:MAG: ribosomal protein L7/L12 [Methylophilaceae bacterium]
MANSEQGDIAMTKEVIEVIKSGRKIQAIKLLREKTGLGLKEAKETVEAYMDNHADIKEVFNANQSSSFSQENVVQISILFIVLLVVYMVL